MKKQYIVPSIRFAVNEMLCAPYSGSLEGIHPEQSHQNSGIDDDYDDNPNTSEIYSKERTGFYEGF